MFANAHYPLQLIDDELDSYLAMGWFRMGQTIFTTNFLRFNQVFYSAIWLRIPLESFNLSNSQKKIKKLNSKFRVTINTAIINSEKEDLFLRYRNSVNFEPSPSLDQLLYSEGDLDIYNSLEFCVYDNNKLIACGILDLGKNSSAGITCFYDPDYKSFSLGKYLMILKMEYSRSIGLKYFYPGYFAPGYPLFDYKLQLSKENIEYYDFVSQSWHTVHASLLTNNPLTEIVKALRVLYELLDANQITCKLMQYEFYDANLIPALNNAELFDQPLFILCFDDDTEKINPIIIFDIISKSYKLILCKSVYRSTIEKNTDTVFSTNLIKQIGELFESPSAEIIVQVIKHGFKNEIAY